LQNWGEAFKAEAHGLGEVFYTTRRLGRRDFFARGPYSMSLADFPKDRARLFYRLTLTLQNSSRSDHAASWPGCGLVILTSALYCFSEAPHQDIACSSKEGAAGR